MALPAVLLGLRVGESFLWALFALTLGSTGAAGMGSNTY